MKSRFNGLGRSVGYRLGVRLGLAIGVLLPMIALALIVWRLASVNLENQAAARLQTAIASRQAQVDRWLDQLTSTLYGITSANPILAQALANGDSASIAVQLSEALKSQAGDPASGDGFATLFAIDPRDGHLIASTDPTQQSVPERACAPTGICVFGPFADGSQWWLGIQYPLPVDNNPAGVALIGLADARHLDLLLDDGQSYLAGTNGNLRWLPQLGVPPLSRALPIRPVSFAVSAPALYDGIFGSPAFGVSVYIPRLSAFLVEEQPLAAIEQPIAFLPAASLSIGALALALTILLSGILIRRQDTAQQRIAASLAIRDARIQALEDAARLRNQSIATMSHELRTSLSATLNFSGFLMDGLFGELSTDQVEPMRQIYDSAGHLLALINDLLDIARVELGQMRLFPITFDPTPLFDQALATLRALLLDKPIRIETDFPTVWPPLYGDRRRILQILLNLVANAAKFTESGTITLRATIDRDNGRDTLEIRVEDSGPGIPPDEMVELFTPFYQGHNAALLEKGGTGLGLPLSRIFARLHGGDLTYTPRPGGGSIFTVRLPLTAPEAESGRSATAA